LRQNHDEFVKRETAVLIVGPENARAFGKYFSENEIAFTGLPDPKHTVLKLYGQQVKLFKFGRMPAQVLVDRAGVVRYVHYGHSMSDIPPAEEMLALIDGLEANADGTHSDPGADV